MANKIGINPWLAMWIKPKSTIRTIVDYNPNYRLFALSAIYGFVSLISSAQTFALGNLLNPFLVLLIAIILSPLWGYIIFSISSYFIYFSGKWISGEAKYKEVRSAIAWSNVPMIGNIILWIGLFIVFGTTIIKDFPGTYLITSVQRSFLLIILFGQLVMSIWVLILYINSLAEVQRFSVGKAILNIIFGVIIFVAIFFVATICYFLIIKAMAVS